MNKDNAYDERYAEEGYYWGKKPSESCEKALEFIEEPHGKKLLDLGCGEGRNAVYFAEKGFRVTALDLSEEGLKKARRYAEEKGVEIKTIHADLNDYSLKEKYDVIFSTGSLQYIPKESRKDRFEEYKEYTVEGGLNVMSVFVKKPFIEEAPDAEESAELYKSGELMMYYHDWKILFTAEKIFDCDSGGVPHRHAIDRVIAKKL